MRRMERAVTLLPQPLSPTMPSVRPAWSSKLAPSTALTIPSSAKKYVRRSFTLRIGTRSRPSRICPRAASPSSLEVTA